MKIYPGQNRRIIAIGILLLFGYGIIAAKLYFEQIKQSDEHRERISRQSVRRIRIPALRGRIFTSEHQLLADNQTVYDAYFYLEEMRRPGGRKNTIKYILDAGKKLAAALHRKNTVTEEKIIHQINLRPGLPFLVFRNLKPEEMARVYELSSGIKGIGIIPRNQRVYPNQFMAAHLIGYTRPENPHAAADRNRYFYYVPDLKGRRGLEKVYDQIDLPNKEIRGLQGEPGYSLVQVDHQGFIHKNLIKSIKPLNGNNIILNLEWRAQKTAENLLRGKRGAIVLLNADTGAALAMASAPAFNLQKFSPRISGVTYRRLLEDPGNPLLNRACSGVYTPGSIIKPLIGLALLENGMDPREQVFCDGGTQIGNRKVRCSAWRSGGHGIMNILTALEHSCNDFFIENGCTLGMENMLPVLRSAGIGTKTGLELPENKGLLPSKTYKYRHYGFAWNKYDTAMLSMGQGIILITPIQAAVYCAALANGGTLFRPALLKEVRNSNGIVLYRQKPKIIGKLAVKPRNLAIIRQGMFRVVNTPGGSGRNAKNPWITLSGKTGTAEIGPPTKRTQNTWFICFGKFRKVNYAAVFMVENGASGGKTCAPLARSFFTQYLSGKR